MIDDNQPTLLRKNQVERIRALAEQGLASARADGPGETKAYWDLIGTLGEIIKVADGVSTGANLAPREGHSGRTHS